MARSARINFGTPDGELIVTADDAGIVQSVYDPETDTEYIGGGGIGIDFECTAEASE